MHPTIHKYLQVIKPGMVLGNLVAMAGGFFLASGGHADLMLLLATAIGTGLVVASGCVFNNIIDRQIDRKMVRTRKRVLARGCMAPGVAALYAACLGIGGIAVLWACTHPLCVTIVGAGFVIYVIVYSLWLKRTSAYSTVIGSLAGAAPPLVGYCAVTHRFDLGAGILLAIFTLWQVPHSYAIALHRLKDYTNARIPVLPLKHGVRAARRHIIGHIAAFLMAAPMLTFSGHAGVGYLLAATAIGLFWLALAWYGHERFGDRRWARRLFIFSILGITALSVMMALDADGPSSVVARLTQTP